MIRLLRMIFLMFKLFKKETEALLEKQQEDDISYSELFEDKSKNKEGNSSEEYQNITESSGEVNSNSKIESDSK